MKNIINEDVVDFLRESNNIEDEWDDDSLAQAIYAWNYAISQDKMTPDVVLKTHKILMLHQKLLPTERGYFRKVPIYIGGHEAKPWFVVPELIENWCNEVNFLQEHKEELKKQLIEDSIQGHHITYEGIHPFVDGNGRTGRIFMNWQRIKAGLPIDIIKEKEKNKYYDWFL